MKKLLIIFYVVTGTIFGGPKEESLWVRDTLAQARGIAEFAIKNEAPIYDHLKIWKVDTDNAKREYLRDCLCVEDKCD